MRAFTAHLDPVRVRFGAGMDGAVVEEAVRLRLARALVL